MTTQTATPTPTAAQVATPTAGFSKYATHNSATAQTVLTFEQLVALAKEPLNASIKNKLPLITPFTTKTGRKTGEAVQAASYSAIILDFDKVTDSMAQTVAKLTAQYQGEFLAFTTFSNDELLGDFSHKIVIPYATPCHLESHQQAAKALAATFGGDIAQATATQGFYAPCNTAENDYDFIHVEGSRLDLSSDFVQNAIKAAPAQALTRATDNDLLALVNAEIKASYAPLTAEQRKDKVTSALIKISPDADRVTWLQVGKGLSIEIDDQTEAFEIFKEWSSKGQTYDANKISFDWKQAQGLNDTTEATLYSLAKKGGWSNQFLATKEAKEAERLAFKMAKAIKANLQLDCEIEQIIAEYEINAKAIERALSETIRNGSRSSEILLLSENEHLNNHAKAEAFSHMAAVYGSFYNAEKLTHDVKQYVAALDDLKTGERKAKAKGIFEALDVLRNDIFWHIEHHNQRSRVGYEVDMFASERKVELTETKAIYTLTHKPLTFTCGNVSPQLKADIVADYLQHFPEFYKVLDFIVASRFASDRKGFYLWIKAPSSWGKGFFTNVLKELGLTTELSVKEVESIFEGKPVGRTPDEFRRSIVTVFNEFKTVKSEIKELESSIKLAPKFEMISEVQLYTKLFLSVENVPSLISDGQIEDQFANRFTLIDLAGRGELDNRPLFAGSKLTYKNAIVEHVKDYLNDKIAEYVALGELEADNKAMLTLADFRNEFAIDKHAERLTDVLPQIAGQFLEYLEAENFMLSTYLYEIDGNRYLNKGVKLLKEWLDQENDRSGYLTLVRRVDDILKLISHDGKGQFKTARFNGKPVKVMKLK